jgi:hypothetical protein
MHSIINDNNFIKISFKKPFFEDFDEIYFVPNMDITYYDNSHVNYIYTETKDNIIYTFHGFFKDNFFIIIYDSYNQKLNTTLQNKNVLIIKINWIEKKYSEYKNMWIIDIPKFNDLKTECFILPIRQKIFNTDSISIDDYLRMYNYSIFNIIIKYVPEKKKKKNILKYIRTFLDI